MSVSSRSRLRGLCLIVALFALFVAAPVAHAAPQYGGPPTPNGGTYLALGDSLAFGYQGYKVTACATPTAGFCSNPDVQFSTGYVNVFANSFSGAYPGVTTVNLGCPGETSATLINATNATTGCTTYPFAIHKNHPNKTQLQAAVQVLRDKGKKVNPVTLNIGANDVLGLVRTCTSDTPPQEVPNNPADDVINLACVQNGALAPGGTFDTIQANLDTTLNTLRAEGGKTKEIIVVGLYNPLYIAILQSQGPAAADGTDALTAALNVKQASTAAKYNAKFVNPLPVINNPQFPYGGEAGSVCYYTLMCPPPNTQPGNPGADIHASDAGYQAIGNLVKTASGY